MKHPIIFLLTFLAFAANVCLGAPARRDIIHNITLPDGRTVQAYKMGDERSHWFETADGTIVAGVKLTDEQLQQSKWARTYSRRSLAPRASRSESPWAGVGLYDQLFPCTGELHTLVIVVEFDDVKLKVNGPQTFYQRMLNEEDFSDYGGTGSARDYFIDGSMGQFKPTFDVFGPVTLPHPVAYYGGNDRAGNDTNAVQMIIDACELLDDEIDFSQYDTDGDQRVDNVFVIFAGQGENSYGSEDTVWPHQWDFQDAGAQLTLDGVSFGHYACTNEWEESRPAGIGTFVHEFSHVMGLPDLYHTSNAAFTKSPGNWSPLDNGLYNNNTCTPPSYSSFERNALGWIDLTQLTAGTDVSLRPLFTDNVACVAPTDSYREFFLFENRQQIGWDEYLPGHGLIIWHIDYDPTKWYMNSVNNTSRHQNVDIEEANNSPYVANPRNEAGYPFPGTSGATSFTDDTTPSMKPWSGKSLGLPITDIAESADGIITFSVAKDMGGIYDIADDTFDGPTSWFTIDGTKIEEPSSAGIYIRRQGSKVSKVMIR